MTMARPPFWHERDGHRPGPADLDDAEYEPGETVEDEPSELTSEVNAATTTYRQARARLKNALQASGFYKDSVAANLRRGETL